MKRILTIQDVSCVGKCSLTVALPVISAAQVEACVLPTAVLSTHTMFKHYTFVDLTDEIVPTVECWKQEGITFDAIYTGYLGSFQQMEIIENLVDDFRTDDSFFFLDPVLGDAGRLYARFDQKFVDRMALFCSKADVITPNMTEATAMLHIPYVEPCFSEEFVKDVLRRLADLGPKIVALTGVQYQKGKIGVAGFDSTQNEFFTYLHDEYPGRYHGTGDLFASAAVAALARGRSIPDSFRIAAEFTADSIRYTNANPNPRSYGVDFENALPAFIRQFEDFSLNGTAHK